MKNLLVTDIQVYHNDVDEVFGLQDILITDTYDYKSGKTIVNQLSMYLEIDDLDCEVSCDEKDLSIDDKGSKPTIRVTSQEEFDRLLNDGPHDKIIEVDWLTFDRWTTDERVIYEESRLDKTTLTKRVNEIIHFDGVSSVDEVRSFEYVQSIHDNPNDNELSIELVVSDKRYYIHLDSSEYSKKCLDYLLGKVDKFRVTCVSERFYDSLDQLCNGDVYGV